MGRLVVAVVALSLLLSGCTEAAPREPASAAPQSFDFDDSGVRITAGPGAVPDGAEAAVSRSHTPSPLTRLGAAGLSTLAPAAEITLDGGSTQPVEPLTVAIDVPQSQSRFKSVVGVVLQSENGDPEFIAGRYDKKASAVVVDVPHLSWVWPVQLDVDKVLNDAMTYVLESTSIATAQPGCTGEEPTIGGNTYSVIQPAQAWVCLTDGGQGLEVDVFANSPVPFQIFSEPAPSSSTPLTDLGDESVVGAAVVRALGLAAANEGLIGPGVDTRFTYDPAAGATLSFRSSPPLLLVQILMATLQPILDAKRIETLGKAKCFHDLVGTAGRSKFDASTAASLTGAMFSCVGEIVELTPVGAVFLALVSAAPQAFAGSFIGLISEFSGLGRFQVQIEATEAVANVPAGFLGEWYVHGGSLTIRPDGTAVSEGHSSCPSGWNSAWCNDVMEMTAVMEGEQLRLNVLRVYVEDENGRRGTPPYPTSASTGSFYLMELLPKGAAITELHNDDGVTPGANGLGNPYLCRLDSAASAEGTCGA